jgi:PD-(D/E)XK nuclease superfamily
VYDFNWYVDRRLVHEFHTSERKSFRGCRRRWDWTFRQGYYPKLVAKPLDFGTAYHAALEVYYNPETWDLPREPVLELAIKVFKDWNLKQRKAAHDSLMYKLEDDIDKDFDDRETLGIEMLRHLHAAISPKEDKDWKPVRVEIEFMVPIPHPDTTEAMWCKCNVCWDKASKWMYDNIEPKPLSWYKPKSEWKGLPVVFAGRIDCLGEDDYGDLFIIDWKTAARIPDDHSFLDLDDQIGSYCWALASIGMNIRGFIYHEQKKGYPQPPPRNKVIRLGRMYSVKQDLDTDYETYKTTVQNFDAEAYNDGRYDSMLRMLEEHGQRFHYRERRYKTTEELDNIRRDLGNEVLDMLQKDLRIYPNPTRSGWGGCSGCAFKEPCTEKTRGGDYQYGLDSMFEKKIAYYLREEASTDRKNDAD